MPKINESERAIQTRVVQFFQDQEGLEFTYYGNLRDQINMNIIPEKLIAWLNSPKGGGYSASLSAKTVEELIGTAGNLQQGLYKANQDAYTLLKYGTKVNENPGEPDKTVYLIDWEHSHNNESLAFHTGRLKEACRKTRSLYFLFSGQAFHYIQISTSTV